jgi:hypothetical protein
LHEHSSKIALLRSLRLHRFLALHRASRSEQPIREDNGEPSRLFQLLRLDVGRWNAQTLVPVAVLT